MPRHETSERWAQLLRGTALVLLVGAGLASIVASGGGGGDPPQPPAPEVVFERDPKVVFRSDGSSVIAYREDTTRGLETRVRLRVGATFFDLGESISSSPDTRLPRGNHALAADASGNAMSIHSSGLRGPTNSGVSPGFRACRSTAAAPAWDCSQLLSANEIRTAIAMTESSIGVALMVYQPTASTQALQSIAHAPSGWSAPQAVADLYPFNTDDSGPAVVYGRSLFGYALYLDTDRRLTVRRYFGLFDQWEGPLRLADPFGDRAPANARLVLHRDAPGARAMALWIDAGPGSGPRIQAWHARASASGDGGSAWSLAGPVPGSECASSMNAAMDAAGNTVVVWHCDSGANAGRVFASSNVGGSWNANAAEIGSAGTDFTPVKLALDAQGNGVAIWRRANELFAASLTVVGGWQSVQSIGVVTTEGRYRNDYDVVMSEQGRGLAVWLRNAGADPRNGTRVAQRDVGPLALALTVQRHSFGGERIPITIRLGAASTQNTLVILTKVLNTGSEPAGSVLLPAGQTEINFGLDSSAVADFTSGRIEATFDGVTDSQPFTLMPEPTALQVGLAPGAVLGGESAVLGLRVSPGYPIALDIQLDSNNTAVPVPAQVSANQGTSASGSLASLPIASLPVSVAQTALVGARFRGVSGSASMQVLPNVAGQFLLRVTVAGSGAVTSNPAGIACPGDCAEPYALNSLVTLTAMAAVGSSFTGWSGDCSGNAANVTVTIAATRACTATFVPTPGVVPPVIVTQPQSLSVAAGANATFSVVATGSNLAYQWRKNDVPIPGAGGPSLTITNVGPANAGNFTVLVSNLVNGSALNGVSSNEATLTVMPVAGWQNMGAPLSQVSSQRIAIAVNNSVATAPVVYAAIAESVAGRIHLLVRRFDGTNWVLVGAGPINADVLVSNTLFTPAIAIDTGGNVSVAWAENGRQLRVKQWNGSAWNVVSDNLNVDTNVAVFSVQLATFGSQLVAAWLETDGVNSGFGRMALKRYAPASLQWTGGSVLPTETSIQALRLKTAATGHALLAFVARDTTLFAFEGPIRLLRETSIGVFAEPCPALPRPPPSSTSGPTLPNVNLGFGLARSTFPRDEPVVVFNNGEAVFALACHTGAWVALDGSTSSGQIATVGPVGEDLIALAVAPGEGSGVALAWSKQTRFDAGGYETTTQVLVNDNTGTAMVAGATPLIQSNSGFAPGQISLGFLSSNAPLLGGSIFEPGGLFSSRVLRHVP